MIVATPSATPVTTPCASTVATLGSSLDQRKRRAVNTLPSLSFGIGVSCTVPVTEMVSAGGTTSMVRTIRPMQANTPVAVTEAAHTLFVRSRDPGLSSSQSLLTSLWSRISVSGKIAGTSAGS